MEIFRRNFETGGGDRTRGPSSQIPLKRRNKVLFEIEKGGSGGERPLVEGSQSVHMADRINKKREKPFISTNAL